MKLEVATWIAFCLCVTGTESLVKSQHSWTGGANSRLEKFQPGKNAQLLLLWLSSRLSFTTVRTTESTDDLIRERGLSCSSTCVASSSSSVWKKLLILCDCTEECQLRERMGGRTLYWSQGKTLRDTADNLQTKYSPMFFYLCISLFVLEKC